MSIRRATHEDFKDMYSTYMAGFNEGGGIPPSLMFTYPFRAKYPEDWEQANKSIVSDRLDMDPSYAHNMVVEADGKVVAWALWRRNLGDAKKQNPPAEPSKTNRAFSKARADALTVLSALDNEEFFQGDHWYLSMLVVHPDYQRRGYGRLLTAYGQHKAREDGVFAALTSTPEGESLYKSMGFEEIGLRRSPWDGKVKIDLEEGEEMVEFFPMRAFKWGKDRTGKIYGEV